MIKITIRRPPRLGPRHLGRALQSAGAMLREAAGAQARVPGSQTVLLLTYGGDAARVLADVCSDAATLSLRDFVAE